MRTLVRNANLKVSSASWSIRRVFRSTLQRILHFRVILSSQDYPTCEMNQHLASLVVDLKHLGLPPPLAHVVLGLQPAPLEQHSKLEFSSSEENSENFTSLNSIPWLFLTGLGAATSRAASGSISSTSTGGPNHFIPPEDKNQIYLVHRRKCNATDRA